MMKKKFCFVLLSFIIISIQLFAAYSIVEKGRWGSGAYYGVYLDGNYAYCSAYRGGVDIIDISNPTRPELVAQMDKLWDFQSVQEVVVNGNYAYAASFFSGIHVLEVSNPTAPVFVANCTSTGKFSGIDVEGSNLFLPDVNGGMEIFSITNPILPELLSRVTFVGSPRDLDVVGNYAYIADYSAGFKIFDVSNPAVPVPAGDRRMDYYPVDITVNGNYAYVPNLSVLNIINLSNLSFPYIATTYNPGVGGASGVAVKGNYAYLSRSYKGLDIVDISAPLNPSKTGSCSVPGLTNKVAVSGNYAYVSAYEKGLQIIDISNPQAPRLAAYFDRSIAPTSISVSGSIITLTDQYEGEFYIDVSEPSDPILAGSSSPKKPFNSKNPNETILTDSPGGYKKRALRRGFLLGNYYYEEDGTNLLIYDYSNPSNPQQISSISGFNCGTSDVYVNGCYAYVAGNATGLYVIDVSDPYNPAYVTKTTDAVFADRVTGNGNFVYVIGEPSGKLYIFEVTSGYSSVSGRVTLSGSPLKDVKLEFSNNGGNAVTDSDGIYSHYVPNGWSGTITPVLTGYSFSPASISLDNVTTNTGNRDFTANPEVVSIVFSHDQLLFASNANATVVTPPQNVTVSNTGTGSFNWIAESSAQWLKVSPTTGTGNSTITFSVSPDGLSAGTYYGTVKVSAQDNPAISQTVSVQLTIHATGTTSPPFGSFDTPNANATVSGSIAVTGWALDDINIDTIAIYRGTVSNPNQKVYIGDAVKVDGARTDIEAAFPNYPLNNTAGWGYMLLTNYLPNNGNGPVTLYAIATDTEGNSTTLGSKSITCDNANAVNPFGAIDTPEQGAVVSENTYINWGWVLTPQPNAIPIDGSTIFVWINGINIGNPTYNIYRSDIASLFPNYANSNGAVGYLYIDTTPYSNGTHTIQWTATDSNGNTDGIGSRFFNISHLPPAGSMLLHPLSLRRLSEGQGAAPPGPPLSLRETNYDLRFENIPGCPVSFLGKTGFGDSEPMKSYLPDDQGITVVTIPPMGRVEIHLGDLFSNDDGIDAFLMVGNRFKPLPIGSTLDASNGIFYWMPGPSFAGNFDLLFINPARPDIAKKIRIIIKPELSDFCGK